MTKIRQTDITTEKPLKCTRGRGTHKWEIEPANGRYSQGKCLKCGKEWNGFENSLTYTEWDSEFPPIT